MATGVDLRGYEWESQEDPETLGKLRAALVSVVRAENLSAILALLDGETPQGPTPPRRRPSTRW